VAEPLDAAAIEVQVSSTLDEFVAAVMRRDADAVADLHADSPETLVIWPGAGEEIRGIEAVRAALRQEMRGWKSVRLALTDREIRVLSADAALVFGHYDQDLEAMPPGSRRPVSRKVTGARFIALLTRQDDRWKMRLAAGSIPLNATMFDALVFPPPFRQRKPKTP
jgi:ketosteroid isomerase-like protein